MTLILPSRTVWIIFTSTLLVQVQHRPKTYRWCIHLENTCWRTKTANKMQQSSDHHALHAQHKSNATVLSPCTHLTSKQHKCPVVGWKQTDHWMIQCYFDTCTYIHTHILCLGSNGQAGCQLTFSTFDLWEEEASLFPACIFSVSSPTWVSGLPMMPHLVQVVWRRSLGQEVRVWRIKTEAVVVRWVVMVVVVVLLVVSVLRCGLLGLVAGPAMTRQMAPSQFTKQLCTSCYLWIMSQMFFIVCYFSCCTQSKVCFSHLFFFFGGEPQLKPDICTSQVYCMYRAALEDWMHLQICYQY